MINNSRAFRAFFVLIWEIRWVGEASRKSRTVATPFFSNVSSALLRFFFSLSNVNISSKRFMDPRSMSRTSWNSLVWSIFGRLILQLLVARSSTVSKPIFSRATFSVSSSKWCMVDTLLNFLAFLTTSFSENPS